MLQSIRKHVKKDDGATAVEYVLLVVVIALVMLAGAILLGSQLKSKFTATCNSVKTGTVSTVTTSC